MKLALVLSLILFLNPQAAFAGRAASKHLEKCEGGDGQACYAYAMYLKSNRDPRAKSSAGIYLRKACTMAYAPACTTRSSVAKNVQPSEATDEKAMLTAVTLKPSIPIRVTIWEAAGFRATPFLIKLLGAKAFAYTTEQQEED